MDEFDKALDDIDGLQEAFIALSDAERSSPLLRNPVQVKKLRRELAAAAEAYATTFMSTHRGELDARRLKTCRGAAMKEMPAARREQPRLAALVRERRLPSPDVRDDVEKLLGMSLHFRAALDAFAPTVDRRAAEALGNKVLVELRDATLRYLMVAREAADGSRQTARAAVVDVLKRTEAHAKGLLGMAPPLDVIGNDASLGASMSRHAATELRETSVEWQLAEAA